MQLLQRVWAIEDAQMVDSLPTVGALSEAWEYCDPRLPWILGQPHLSPNFDCRVSGVDGWPT